MPGNDLIAGNITSTALLVTGSAQFSTGGLSFTGLYTVTISTAVFAAVGVSTSRTDLIPSTSFTFSTNDRILSLGMPQSGMTAGLGFAPLYPTSSGGVAFTWINPTTGGTLTPAAPSSTSAYILTVLRTT